MTDGHFAQDINAARPQPISQAREADVRATRLHLHVLGSGSKGNCVLVEGPEGIIMVDDGFSRREVLRRMNALGIDEALVRAVIITHEHSDHVKGLPVWCKRFAGELYASKGTPGTRSTISDLPFFEFEAGDELEIAGIAVRTFPTSHDVANPIGLRFDCRDDSIGLMTDTGIVSPQAREVLEGSRILALESNHDVSMLRNGDYPRHLQDRILSEKGHLSNEQAAEAVTAVVGDRTEYVVAMHISQENNRPSLAVRSLAGALGAQLDDELGSTATLTRAGGAAGLRICAAGQNRPISIR